MKKPSIVVSNPIRLHSHHQVYALQQKDFLQKFICSSWHKPQQFPYTHFKYLPSFLFNKAEAFCKKRCHEKIDPHFVEQHPLREVSRVLINQLSNNRFNKHLVDWQQYTHDKIVAKRMKKLRPNILIGYEISCAKSFYVAKKMGITTILDLANVHYKYCTPLEEIFDGNDFNTTLTQRINQRKQIEYDHSDYIFCISTLAYQSLINNGIPKEKIHLINLGADLSIFHPKKYKKSKTFSLLFVGSVIKRKGIHLLLQALSELQLPNIDFTIIGASDHNNILRSYDRSLYTHIPFLSHKDLVKYYQKADLFVLPSYLDSWGMVVTEAMACGTPVLISDNVGSKDLVIEGQNGFIVPSGDLQALKKQILYCYHNKEKLFSLGQNAYHSVQDFTWEKYACNLSQTIEAIIS
ncbi:glycosyltransferase family 4 protein [Candidatus Uabimicrobium sp. HlEnr_7]|uniref:glycosyltransferase family 4 protein n=1 Tax=Candidatus Uabimicrobium helgolandensis TaxID=3095367 RepID=UPI0035564F97